MICCREVRGYALRRKACRHSEPRATMQDAGKTGYGTKRHSLGEFESTAALGLGFGLGA